MFHLVIIVNGLLVSCTASDFCIITEIITQFEIQLHFLVLYEFTDATPSISNLLKCQACLFWPSLSFSQLTTCFHLVNWLQTIYFWWFLSSVEQGLRPSACVSGQSTSRSHECTDESGFRLLPSEDRTKRRHIFFHEEKQRSTNQ